jgi:2-polyprenyl-6-methoxyphenol hydroxylase-like FAD-dependent oxidoreductase
MSSSVIEHDVVVVGARCAGAATAVLLARQGHDVALIDRATFPSDTLSTHSIARGGVVQLNRWGLLDDVVASGAPPIRTVTFHQGTTTPVARTVKERAGVDHLLAPRRHVLDSLLVSVAADAGAAVHQGITVTGTIIDDAGRVSGVTMRDDAGKNSELRARVVLGADGVRSRIARSVDARVLDRRSSSGSALYVYVAGLDAEGFEFHASEGSFAGVCPTNAGEANVWCCLPGCHSLTGRPGEREAAFVDLLREAAPSLAARVDDATITSGVRQTSGLPNHVLQAAGPGWALVGDAGYHRDPITGHGMTDAFRDAELLAWHLGRALCGELEENAALAAYADERTRALVPIFDVTTRVGGFPPLTEFVELQKRYSDLIEDEAAWLAGRPELPTRDRLVAA